MLKAVIAKRTEAFPPRLHNLMRLAEYAQLELAKEQSHFVRELSGYYTQTRYPDEMGSMSVGMSREAAQRVLNQAEEMVAWLSSMM